jgi:hypothetical protein
MIWPQGFSGFDCQFEGLKRLHDMAAVGRHANDAQASIPIRHGGSFWKNARRCRSRN